LVFIIRIHHDARSYECQITYYILHIKNAPAILHIAFAPCFCAPKGCSRLHNCYLTETVMLFSRFGVYRCFERTNRF